MNAAVSSTLYVTLLVTALWSARSPAMSRTGASRRGVGTVVALVLVAVPSLLQLTVAPALLNHLERNGSRIAHGELWRLVTSLIVQDGGWLGTAFNLAFLVLVGAAAERLWGTRRWLWVALASGVGAQLWGLLVQPVGAGNSVVNFGLAASMAVVAVRRSPGSSAGAQLARVVGAVSLLVALVLLVTGDIHGGAAAIGAVAGALLTPPVPRESGESGPVVRV